MAQGFFSRNNITRAILFALAISIISFVLPRDERFEYSYSSGKPWTYSLLTAPFDMPIKLDSASINHQKDSIAKNFVQIYKVNDDQATTERTRLAARLDQLAVSAYDKATITNVLLRIYEKGIVDSETFALIEAGKLPSIRYVINNVATPIATDEMVSPKKAYSQMDSILHLPSTHEAFVNARLTDFIIPNIVVDTLLSKKLITELYQKAIAPIGVMQKGERIVDRGEIITPQTFTLLQTYQSMMNERNQSVKGAYYPLIGQILILTIFFAILYVFLYLFRWRFFNDMRKMGFLMLLMVIFTVFSFIVSEQFTAGIYIIPFAAIPIIITIFFDSRTALFVHIVEIFICTLVAPYALEFILLQFIAGVTAINSLKDLTKRSELIRCAMFIFFGYCITYLALIIMREGNIDSLNYKVFMYFAFNAVLLSFIYILIFVIEKFFGFVSTVTLVELSDVNSPLLRELSQECPGTFQHSLQVSNLAAEAAHAINANVQLVRTGALYHDIGKINNPAFFTENQHGVNPHHALSPEQSASIVINHVHDGLKRADKAKLPSVIQDFITQHHGTGKAKYFHTIACNNNPGVEIDEAPFTYPGPLPNSKETSILMMADACEAASRSLTDHTDESITTLVNKMIDTQIADGLFKNSPLSFRDVEAIKQTFIDRLRTIYHTRVSYPEKNQHPA